MTIVKGPARGTSGGGAGGGGGRGGGGGGGRRESYREGGGGGGGGDWSRGSAPPRRQSSQGDNKQGGGGGGGGGGSSWARGVAPPKPKPDNNQRNHRGGRGGHGQNQPPLYDGPVAPLAMSDNRWRPQKSSSAMLVAEKMVKSILNKMTKEKFDRLSQQMVDVPILSYAMLTMMIENVYDKAIDEPTFGDMYGDLCLRLSQSVGAQNFLHIVESDEEPPTEDGESAGVGESSHNTVYRWSNDISTTDSDIVGPFGSVQDCIDAALDRETDASPVERGEMELVLEKACIKQGMFMKILKKKEPEADDDKVFYVVYFEVSDAEECDQQLSEIFLSDVEAKSDATKTNSFKRSLLNKCEEEFNKQDIYVDWKKEKKEYEENKSTMTAPAIKEKEDDLNFRRIRIKKQMLGNVKFIGQLFKKKLLKEKVMRYCIASLLKLDEIDEKKGKNPEYKDAGDFSMDEEDHEAICSMFATIGSTIDTGAAASFMKVCFGKIDKMSKDQSMPSRSRFMYKDLIELRQNRWIPRRKEEKALTLDEIRKEVEREERKQAQESAQNHGHGGYNQRGRGGDQRFDNRNDNRNQRQQSFGSGRPRQPKPVVETDADGFTVIASARGGAPPVATKGSGSKQPPAPASSKQPVKKSSAPSKPAATAAEPSKSSGPAPLSEDKLKRRIKSMRSEFIGDGGNVDELILTFEELTGTPDYAVSLIQMNADDIMECKEDDRQAIIKIVTILAEKKKVTSEDIKKGLADTIEFIDSFVVDSPRAFEYLGQLLASLLRIGTIEVDWVCTASESTKADPNTKAPSRIVGETLKALSAAAGKDTAESKFNASQESLAKLLGGADQWNAIKVEYLG
jgi:translation initiation factor 4G